MPNMLEQAITERSTDDANQKRRMGIEIEFIGVEPSSISAIIQQHFGGSVVWLSPFEVEISDTEFGTFKLELDSQQIKDLGEQSDIAGNPADEPKGFERTYLEVISSLATHLVPWEIVTPPVPIDALASLYPMITDLRLAGAKGTRDAIHYAFGVHLNPELVATDAQTIVRHLQSFFCLYDWIKTVEKTDITRRMTPYINHFDKNYIALVLANNYQPNQAQLIDDYLLHNSTRNRSLDMLPLFKHLDSQRVLNAVSDERVNARPTFHYRLPNCDIGNSEWNLDLCIELWMTVEALAASDSLVDLNTAYLNCVTAMLPITNQPWIEQIEHHLEKNGLMPNIVHQLASE